MNEKIQETLMDDGHIHMNTIEIMMKYYEIKYHCCLLDIVSRVILLVNLKLSGGISYDFTILHQYTAKSNAGRITINNKALSSFW